MSIVQVLTKMPLRDGDMWMVKFPNSYTVSKIIILSFTQETVHLRVVSETGSTKAHDSTFCTADIIWIERL